MSKWPRKIHNKLAYRYLWWDRRYRRVQKNRVKAAQELDRIQGELASPETECSIEQERKCYKEVQYWLMDEIEARLERDNLAKIFHGQLPLPEHFKE